MIRVSGASDDICSIDGDVRDEIRPGSCITIGTTDRGVRVTMKYIDPGVWSARIAQIEEGVPMFPITVVDAPPHGHPDPRSYSVEVCVDCPTGTPVFVRGKNLALTRVRK